MLQTEYPTIACWQHYSRKIHCPSCENTSLPGGLLGGKAKTFFSSGVALEAKIQYGNNGLQMSHEKTLLLSIILVV